MNVIAKPKPVVYDFWSGTVVMLGGTVSPTLNPPPIVVFVPIWRPGVKNIVLKSENEGPIRNSALEPPALCD